MTTLEQYLRECEERHVIDHSLRVQKQADGSLSFYIHPAQVSGDTLDFKVSGNVIRPAGWATGFKPEVVEG